MKCTAAGAAIYLCDVADDGQKVCDGDASGDQMLLQRLQALAAARDRHNAHARLRQQLARGPANPGRCPRHQRHLATPPDTSMDVRCS